MKTIFEGIINGEKFDSVQAYNARMIELMNAGKEVNASSRTKSVDETSGHKRIVCDMSEEKCSSKDLKQAVKELVEVIEDANDNEIETEAVSFYPYFDDEEPYYLDSLVTNDPKKNRLIYNEVCAHITEVWPDILEFISSDNVCVCDKKDYLNDVHDIISSINNDAKHNSEALKRINEQKLKADAEFAEAKMKYEKTIDSLKDSKSILDGATAIINLLKEFYHNVESEGLTQIANSNKNCNCKECDTNHSCCCNSIETDCIEKQPQMEMEIAQALGKLWTQLMEGIDTKSLN